MNKPIVAHSFEEMNKLDAELVNNTPLQKRKAAWKAITEVFADSTSLPHRISRRRLIMRRTTRPTSATGEIHNFVYGQRIKK